MVDFIIVIGLLAIIGLALWYIIRAKKRGAKCIGCPYNCGNAKSGDEALCCCGKENPTENNNFPLN